MNAILSSPSRAFPGGGEKENEIREIFYQHWEKMKNELEMTRHNIWKWRDNCIEKINNHADKQLQILIEDYRCQRLLFDQSRRENIDTAMTYGRHHTQQAELFDQLRNECRKLEFEVAKLETIKEDMKYVKVVTVEDHQKIKRENSKLQQNIKKENNVYENEKKLYSNLPTTNLGGANRQLSHNENSTTNNLSVSNDNGSRESRINTNNDSSEDKCPICFMIYPSSMNFRDRNIHINEH